MWNALNPKIKNSTIDNNYENVWLKAVNIASKINRLQSSCIKRSFDESFYDWRTLPLQFIHKSLGIKFVFHSNLQQKLIRIFENTRKKLLTPKSVNFHVKSWDQLQFYLSFYSWTVKSK